MQIVKLESRLIRVPMRKEFKHASHVRRFSDNVVVCCELADGTRGWGEGVPRSYVTGETADDVMQRMANTCWSDQLAGNCDSWEEVIALCGRIRPELAEEDPRGCRTNSLRCAVELSVLDAFGRLFGEPLSAVTHHFEAAKAIRASLTRIRYSGAVGIGTRRKEALSALKMRIFGFGHCKVKVGMKGADDAGRLRRIRRWLGCAMDIRLDANEGWPASEVVGRLEPLVAHGISCVEQPVPHEEVECLAEVRRRISVPIMLDESLTSLVDGQRAIRAGTCDLFNLRLSKCGGYLGCLQLASLAHTAGLHCQLGCHPGETGLLSAAGRHFAGSVGGIRYREGSYDRFLLKQNVINENITFGYGGWAPALDGPGLGVTIRPDALERLTVSSQQHDLNE